MLKTIDTQDLRIEINIMKEQIKELQKELCFVHTKILKIETRLVLIENKSFSSTKQPQNIPISQEDSSNQQTVSTFGHINFQKWHIFITLKSKGSFELKTIALLDSGSYQNRIKERLVPSQYSEKTIKGHHNANGTTLKIKCNL